MPNVTCAETRACALEPWLSVCEPIRVRAPPLRDRLEPVYFQNLLQSTEDRLFFKDRESRFLLVSAGWLAALGNGRSLEEVLGKTDFDFFSRPHATQAYEDEQHVIETGEPMAAKLERETFHDRPDVWVSTTKLPLLDEQQNIIGTWGNSRVVTAQVQAEQALAHQALHDPLTDLPNRVLVLDRAQQMLARAHRQNKPVAALFVDVDGFKHVNDSFGHAAGDDLLRIVAERLMTVVREGDTAARLGGDEFVVLLEGSTLDAGPELVAERLLEVLRQPCEIASARGRPLSITASVGIAIGAYSNADELLRDADLAMYEAKTSGHNCYKLFESSMQTCSQDRLTLEMDLAEAVEREQLFLLYQPTFDLRTEGVIGVEALIRWGHPTRGVLAPEAFIPIAEDSGLIVPIGRWVLKQACLQAAIWQAAGRKVGMSVNVSGRQLDEDVLIDDVRQAIEVSGLDPALLTLEVTETTLMRDPEGAAERLHRLKQLGVRIAIDDFGTGYSSLAYLRQFPADALKIDRSFIGGIATSNASAALIHTLVQLGKTLGIETLAEGIEDQSQLETLQRERCDLGQGFLFSRPLSVDDIEQFLNVAEPSSVESRSF